ncbi:tRNA (guanosine(37)-N1)-methyltransferase TrmD [bacterium]|nr:tRNA (guanosine(37)-N1)-methyltransferase TrmD [bacterium]MBQ9149427.1 tRNA (guanosine(37)-N1)-methyltransferase TrmD [bacterium]
MIYDVITLFPEIISGYCSQSITKRGIENNIINVNTYNPRDYSLDKHKRVDDTPYGGGDGMVLACQPIFDCYNSIEKKENFEFIMLTPQGERFNQKIAVELSKKEQIILLCGHYEGFDERIRLGLKPREISIGDYVLTGGELPALILMDSISRNLENYLGKDKCAHDDSFSQGLEGYLEYPHYTKPREFLGMKVPDVLLNGNHKEIQIFRKEESIKRTKTRRPDLFD